MKKLVLGAVAAYLMIVVLFYWKQRELMYPPAVSTFISNIQDAPDMQWIEVETEDNLTLRSWYKPSTENKPTILAFHGNGGTIWHLIPHARIFSDHGYGILLAEYRFYGGNPGAPSEEGFHKDGNAHFKWLKENDVNDIIIYGQSLGSAVAVNLATKVNAKALILEVPFSNALDVAQHKYPFLPFLNILMHDQYHSDKIIQQVDEPLLIGLAERDTEVPPRFGKALFAAANEPKTLKNYNEAGHEELYNYGFGADLISFIEELESDH